MDEEKQKEWRRRYYLEHRQEIAQKVKQWKKTNREKANEWARQWRKLNPEKAKQRARHSRHLHAETRKRYAKIYNARYKKLHSDANKEYMRKYRASHVKERREYVRRQYRENPEYRERIIMRNLARRARNKNIASDVTVERIELLNIAQKRKCAYCNKRRKLTMDHIVPISKGGVHLMSNIALACKPCNSRKKDRIISTVPPIMVLPL